MMRRLGILMGSAFLFGGLLGYVPGVVKDGMYLGIFMVNTPHNLMHIISGAVFLIASLLGPSFARLWFQVFGIFYAVLSAWGLRVGEGIILGVIPNNRADSWGHAGLALAMLLVGFVIPAKTPLSTVRSSTLSRTHP
jgi:Domain of unknown function (DUF4383)